MIRHKKKQWLRRGKFFNDGDMRLYNVRFFGHKHTRARFKSRGKP